MQGRRAKKNQNPTLKHGDTFHVYIATDTPQEVCDFLTDLKREGDFSQEVLAIIREHLAASRGASAGTEDISPDNAGAEVPLQPSGAEGIGTPSVLGAQTVQADMGPTAQTGVIADSTPVEPAAQSAVALGALEVAAAKAPQTQPDDGSTVSAAEGFAASDSSDSPDVPDSLEGLDAPAHTAQREAEQPAQAAVEQPTAVSSMPGAGGHGGFEQGGFEQGALEHGDFEHGDGASASGSAARTGFGDDLSGDRPANAGTVQNTAVQAGEAQAGAALQEAAAPPAASSPPAASPSADSEQTVSPLSVSQSADSTRPNVPVRTGTAAWGEAPAHAETPVRQDTVQGPSHASEPPRAASPKQPAIDPIEALRKQRRAWVTKLPVT